ncbi:sensor histidine kinase [Sporosarcina saromensis]|uniref:histidine kinase n=1 Tax=Sporosarcina saromensis TaxID=359365 RepID=A0ABU4G6I9_9BACL|nr:sensor histidine kinase [Sporosarcina saromensis]MDW0112575.1 sensor histidine kinase [Sporosarcina saromensis]
MRQVLLFLKEYLSWIIFEMLLVTFILLLYWLDGFRGLNTAIYSIIMSIMLLTGFLGAKFITRRAYYNTIVKKPKRMEDALIRKVQTPEQIESARFMRDLYGLYQNEVQTLYASQHRQLHFMNQWVHQMKTPISVIGLLLQEDGELDKRSVQEEIEKLQRGLDAVLVNARLETFEEDMQIEQVGLKGLIQQIVTEHKRLFITNGVYPVISIDERIVVATDAKWLKIVIGQFITNAVKYTFEKGKHLYLTLEKTEEGFALTIRDEGIGIPASDLKRVTKAFFTGENGRLTGESTGMGLYIAQEVCEKLGHSLTIESEVGQGTSVKILFMNGEGGDVNDEETDRGNDASDEDL